MKPLIITLLCAWTLASQAVIYPQPQHMKTTGKQITLPERIRILGTDEADSEALNRLLPLFSRYAEKKGFTVIIGEKGDKAVSKYRRMIPAQAEGYYLSIQPDQIVIAGNDGAGTFYGVQTLLQLLKNNKLPETEITDYPVIALRGTVEGFYGQPWSHRDRISQLDFYGQNKMNTYIYGPKDDPYHSSPNWRKPYPAEEARHISELVEVAKANKVNFVWAIHPGQDIRWNEEDRNLLLHKFELMYQLGVRSFALFFDDISGEGTDPDRQAELLNFLHNHFVAAKKDVTPLIMCPTQYNKSWANPKPGTYLDILGDKLHPSIQIMWTGDRVISDITTEGLEWINKRIKRPAYIWWNFPVSDYVRDHLLLGRSYGLDTTAGKLMSGFVSNPMDKAEASKVAIYGVADYAWNPLSYDSHKSWEQALRNVMPTTAGAFRTFASHNSDMGKNGHGYRREESVEITPTVTRFTEALGKGQIDQECFRILEKEFSDISKTPEILREGNDNPALLAEISPWLDQFELLGKSGKSSLELLRSLRTPAPEAENCWNRYCYVLNLSEQQQAVSKNSNRNPYQPGIKTGSLVMQPLADALKQDNGQRLYALLNGGQAQAAGSGLQTKPVLTSDVDQLKQVQLQTSDQSVAITPLLEVVRLGEGQQFAITLPLTLSKGTVEANLNNKTLAEWAKLEISADGNQWTPLPFTMKGNDLKAPFEDKEVKLIRFTNSSNTNREFHLKNFRLTSEQLSGKGGNSLTAIDGDLSTAYTLTGSQVFENPVAGTSGQVIILSAPDAGTNFTVYAIDGQNRKHLLKRNLDAFCRIGLKGIDHVKGISIESAAPTRIHEIIWNR